MGWVYLMMGKKASFGFLMLLLGCALFLTTAAGLPNLSSRTAQNSSPAPAPDPVAEALAAAIDIDPAQLVSASLGDSDPAGTRTATTPIGDFFPRQGDTFAILSTGLASNADAPDTNNDEIPGGGGVPDDVSAVLGGLDNSQGNDLVQLTLVLSPPAGQTSLSFDFAFYTEEFPDFIGTDFNDAFLAELGAEPFSSTIVISGTEISAPNNIAFDPNGRVISINAAYGFDPADPNPDTGTTYDGTSGLLRATGCLPEDRPTGNVVLVLSVTDLGDSIIDSAVFLDNFQWSNPPQCKPGVQQLLIELAPATATNPVGTPHTVTATVRNEQGDLIPDQVVGFAVSGANSAGGSATTGADGQATFTYTGAVPGQDTITAWVDRDLDGDLDPDEPAAEASQTLVAETWDQACVTERVEIDGVGMGDWDNLFNPQTIALADPADVRWLLAQVAGRLSSGTSVPDGVTFSTDAPFVVTLPTPASTSPHAYLFETNLLPGGQITASVSKPGANPPTPRGLLLYASRATTEEWTSVGKTTNGFVWQGGGVDTYAEVLSFPPLEQATELFVSVAVIDNNDDQRPMKVRAEAGGVAASVTEIGPSHGPLLNIVNLDLSQVPAGTGQVRVVLESPADANGDSLVMVGLNASYQCAGDVDADSIPTSVEGSADFDGDGVPNYRDSDSDGDGLPDSDEWNSDADGDGVAGPADRDADGDGHFNFLDPDSDNDGLADRIEGLADHDGNGIADFLEPRVMPTDRRRTLRLFLPAIRR